MLKFRKYEALLRSGFIIIKTQLYFKYFIIYTNDNIYIYIYIYKITSYIFTNFT